MKTLQPRFANHSLKRDRMALRAIALSHRTIEGRPQRLAIRTRDSTTLESVTPYVRSDTLFGAICNATGLLYGDDQLEEMLEAFRLGEPPFLISSAYPSIGDVHLLPVPLSCDLVRRMGADPKSEVGKRLRKVGLVSHELFVHLCTGEDISSLAEVKWGVLLTHREAEGVAEKPWSDLLIPHVSLDRLSAASSVYSMVEMEYMQGACPYFLVDIRDRAYHKRLMAALRLLADEGIGGKRSWGMGQFAPLDLGEVHLPTPEEWMVTLSLYHPRKDELGLLSNAMYSLVERGGWIASPGGNRRKKSVLMVGEGSVVPAWAMGEVVDVKPDGAPHPVYAYGYAIGAGVMRE